MKDVKISVLIPVFNAEKTILRCIESLLNQTFPFFEIIAVNDGSSDNSQRLLETAAESDSRIRLFSQRNQGVSAARNAALNMASGDYIMFVDGDDYVESDYLQAFYDAIDSTQSDIVIGGCTKKLLSTGKTEQIIPPELGDITDSLWLAAAKGRPVIGFVCGKIIRRDLVENNKLRFDVNMYSQEDLNFYLDVYNCAEKVTAISNTGYIYEYTQSDRQPDTLNYIRNKLKILKICREKNKLSDEIAANIQKKLKNYSYGYLINSSDIKKAISDLQAVPGLSDAMKTDKVKTEKDWVCTLLTRSHSHLLRLHLTLRNILKKISSRGKQ